MWVISDLWLTGGRLWCEHAFITIEATIKDIFTTSKTNAMQNSTNAAVCNTIMSCLTGKISFVVAQSSESVSVSSLLSLPPRKALPS